MTDDSVFSAKTIKQKRKCEVVFAYNPMNQDELELVVGETIEIIKEVELSLLLSLLTFELIIKQWISTVWKWA